MLFYEEPNLVAGDGGYLSEPSVMGLFGNSGGVVGRHTDPDSNTRWAVTDDGTTFLDRDLNGSWDYAFNGSATWDSSTNSWHDGWSDPEIEMRATNDPYWFAIWESTQKLGTDERTGD